MKASVGDIVISCLPYAHVLMGKERGRRCDECFMAGSLRERTLNRCSKCRIAHYCSPSCQRSAWSLHKPECEAFLRTKPDVPTESVRLMARLVLKYERKEHLVKEMFQGSLGSRCFDDLMSHVEDLLSDPVKSQSFVTAWETLRMFLGPSFVDALFPGDPRSAGDALALQTFKKKKMKSDDKDEENDEDENDIQSSPSSILVGAAIFGRISVNSFSILDVEHQPIGVGVYLPASKIDHACDGNVTPFFDGVRLGLRAREDIEKLTFANLSLCYVEPLSPTWDRRENLFSQYFFNCRCKWCSSSSPSDQQIENLEVCLRVTSSHDRLDSFPLSSRDARLLSLRCACAENLCPKTGRACDGVVQLTRARRDQSETTAPPPPPKENAISLTLSEHYSLDLTDASLSECDVCLCSTNAEKQRDSISQLVALCSSSKDALKAIEDVRKGEGRISKAEERTEHFQTVLTLCQNLLQRQSILHPYNYFMLYALDQAFDICIHLGKWKEALFYGQKTLAPFRYYHPSPHPTSAMQILKVAKLLAYLEPVSSPVMSLFSDAVEMLRLTHGPSGEGSGRVTAEAEELLDQLRDEIRAKESFQGLSIEDRGDGLSALCD